MKTFLQLDFLALTLSGLAFLSGSSPRRTLKLPRSRNSSTLAWRFARAVMRRFTSHSPSLPTWRL